MMPLGWAMAAAIFLQTSEYDKQFVIKSKEPRYVATLPESFDRSDPKEFPRKYFHPCGRDTWEKVCATLAHGAGPLEQNPAGVTLEEILPFVKLPPDSKNLFSTTKWNDLDIGVIEYQATEGNLPIIGLAAVLPLQGKAITLTVSAPTPLEKEVRADFREILSHITDTRVAWYTAEVLGTMKTLDLVGKIGAGILLLYPVGWFLFFRGDPMRGHWVRVGWLAAAAILMFMPITSPGPTTMINNLVVNALVPLLLLTLVVRRVKMGIDTD